MVRVAGRHHPCLLFSLPAPVLSRPSSVVQNTHWGYWRTGSTSVYALALGAVDVGICNTGCLSPSCMFPPALLLEFSPLPRRTARLKWKKGCVMSSCRLCVCLPVRGREWQSGVTHLITLADWGLFLASNGTLLKLKLYAVFSPIIISSCAVTSVWLSFIWHWIFLHFIYCKTCYHITRLRSAAHDTYNSLLSSCQLTPWVHLKK